MPTARELLEQADVLMRRNRGGDTIPLLTDIVEEESAMPTRTGPSTRERARAAEPPQDTEQATGPAAAAPARDMDAFALTDEVERELEPPLLTDAVEEAAIDLGPAPRGMAEGEPSVWPGPDTIDPALHSITGPGPDTVAVVPPVTLRAVERQTESAHRAEERDATVTRTLRAAGSAPTPPPTGSMPSGGTEVAAAPMPPESVAAALMPSESVTAEPTNDEERWRALADQISMQVLQRLDLFIDTGLKAQLASHLQPIVARAGAELVEAINAHVGQLVRTYVAEAIEREIAQWRKQQE
jgi:hypothetical protein